MVVELFRVSTTTYIIYIYICYIENGILSITLSYRAHYNRGRDSMSKVGGLGVHKVVGYLYSF